MIILVLLALVLAAMLLYLLQALLGRRWPGAAASGTLMLTWVILLVTLAVRGVLAGHWPLSSQYEFTLCFAWIVLAVYLLMESYWQERRAGLFVSLILLALLARAATMPEEATALGPLPPVLRSVWLQGHVLTIMVGYGACAVAASLALASLFARERGSMVDSARPAALPPWEGMQRMMRRLLALGYPWLTLGILTGAVWAHMAWGRYWGWDPKETWALITWLWYLLVFHLQALPAWRGRRYSVLVLIGFGLILFTFIGVPALARALELDTLHGY